MALESDHLGGSPIFVQLWPMARSKQSPPKPPRRDLGFGNRLYRRGIRFINKDGSFNTVKTGRKWLRPYDLYVMCINMGWGRFLMYIFFYYFSVNTLFSLIYLAVGIEHLEGTVGETPFEHWMDAFFFSAQTITTLGYGRISPVGAPASVVAAFESLIGLLGFALVTGILYGRFSRPNARIKFSENAIVAPYQDRTGLMFRIANERSTELIELEVQFIISYIDFNQRKRAFKPLPLELNKINFLSLSWTIVHPIDEESPLYDMDAEELAEADTEFLILVKGFDDTFSQTVYKRYSYRYDEVVWGAKFISIIVPGENNTLRLELDRINDFEEVDLEALAKDNGQSKSAV